MATKYRVTIGTGYEEFKTEAEALTAYPAETPEPITYDPDEGVVQVTWDDVNALQESLLATNTDVMKRIVRYQTQLELAGKTPKETSTKYQELLQYCDDVRDNDETLHATPQEALDALNALTIPV